MTKIFNIRLEDQLIERIKEEANLRGLSQKDLVIKALEHFFACKKAEEIPSLKEIITIYKGKCSRCGRVINVGERALWGKTHEGSVLLCSECQINSETDKTIVRRLIKRRRLEREIKALQNQLDYLAGEYESKRFILDFQKAKDIILEMHKSFMEYQREFWKYNPEETNLKINEMIETLRTVIKLLNDFETFYQLRLNSKTKRLRKNQRV